MLEEVNRKRMKLSDDMTMKKHKPSTFTFSTMKWSSNGIETIHQILELGDWIIVQLSGESVIAVDIQSHQLLRLNEEDLSEMKQNEVLDLNDEGERWEGDVLNNEPYGWGVLYDSDNRRVYEGFRVREVNVCYGRSYYPDIQNVEYEGEILNGKRWGRGIQYDRSGLVMYDGEWMNDEHVEKRVEVNDETQLLHNWIEELIAYSGYDSKGVLDFSPFNHLRELQMGGECINNVKEVKLIGMHALEKMVVERIGCCYRGISGSFCLRDCERLKELRIDDGCFMCFSVFEVENLPSLEVITIGVPNYGHGCFNSASLKLEGFCYSWK